MCIRVCVCVFVCLCVYVLSSFFVIYLHTHRMDHFSDPMGTEAPNHTISIDLDQCVLQEVLIGMPSNI